MHRKTLQRHRLREADGDDGILAALGEPAKRLLELGLVTGLEFSEGDAGILLELLRTRAHAFVEGFIELSARAVDDGGLDGGSILLTLILFILARVFRHGAAMREDLEGTV